MSELQIVHEHPLHLIITSDDLNFFDHIHPVPQADGSLAIEYRFPHDGNYLLFADLAPRGDRAQVFRIPVVIGGLPDPEPALVPLPAPACAVR